MAVSLVYCLQLSSMDRVRLYVGSLLLCYSSLLHRGLLHRSEISPEGVEWDTLPTASLRLRRIAGWERRIVCSDCLYCGNRFVTYSSHSVRCVFFSSIAFVLDLNLSVSVFL